MGVEVGTVARMRIRSERRSRRPAGRAAGPAGCRSVSVLAVVALVVVAGCSSAERGADSSTTSRAVATTTTEPVTTVATTAPPTAPPPVAAFPTPTAAGAALFGAWTTGDRATAGALNLAPASELDKLYAAAPGPSVKNRGCDDGDFGDASCFFGNGQGGVNVGLVPAAGGWSIATIDPFG